jgi:uncharacterized membrane protein
MEILSVIADWLHLLATVVWIGGMAFNVWVLRPSLTSVDPSRRIKLGSAVLNRFIYLAWACIATLISTGIFIARPRGGAIYGFVMTAKHMTVLAMVLIVAVISFVLFPKSRAFVSKINAETRETPSLSSTEPPPELRKVQGQMVLLVKLNLTLGVLVLLFTAILGGV